MLCFGYLAGAADGGMLGASNVLRENRLLRKRMEGETHGV